MSSPVEYYEDLIHSLCEDIKKISHEIDSICEEGSHPGVPQTENREIIKLSRKLRTKCSKTLKSI